MGRMPPPQLVLNLDPAPRYGIEDYLVTPAVAVAHGLVTRWPDWPSRALLLAGPEGCGKSHLAALWAAQSGADTLPAASLDMAALDAAPADTCFVIEDIDNPAASETALFHILNLVREKPFWTLLTARQEPSLLWPRLPDLASRLRQLALARIEAPDDALVRAVLVKLFDDRQLVVEEGVIDFIARRIDRSIGAARDLVAAVDREALAAGRRITRAVAGNVLERLGSDEDL
jgi:chromosomal replication initiation ATPase DnaA